jgi:hypothetical protein
LQVTKTTLASGRAAVRPGASLISDKRTL